MTKMVLFSPELFYVTMAAVFFALSLQRKVNARSTYVFAVALASVGLLVAVMSAKLEGMLFFDSYRVDFFSQVFKIFVALGTFLVIFVCDDLKGVEDDRHPEFYFLLSICTLGMMMLVSAVELLAVYISLELSSYSLYLLVPMRRGPERNIEAAVKYFIIGACASGLMIFGASYLFGVTHTTYIADMIKILPKVIGQPAAIIGLVLTLSGFFFKQALFPFHSWAPDVYEGSANQVTVYIATASKMAAAALVIRFVGLAGGESVFLKQALVVLCVLSMSFGNLVAIIQKDVKRLLAYSSIAHAGYMLMGILSMTERGYASAIFYAGAYLVMNFACFMVVLKIAADGKNLKIKELAGLHKRSPLLAMTLMLGLFGLAGIPPTVGFTGKFYVFAAAMEQGYLALVVIGMLNATISLYYYLIVIKAAYLLEPVDEYPEVSVNSRYQAMSIALVIVMVYLGMFPDKFITLAEAAAKSLL